jgi:hypothetical protein
MAAIDAQEICIQHDSSSVIPRSYDMIDAVKPEIGIPRWLTATGANTSSNNTKNKSAILMVWAMNDDHRSTS